jgi:hypothetical protein
MGSPLEIAGAHKRTEKGNNDEYYGGGGVAHASTSAACAFVPLAIREGKTVGVWENGKVVEYIWHTDTSNTGLLKKTADLSAGAKIGAINTLTGLPAFEFVQDGDINSELVFGTASTTGQIQKLIGLRAGGDKGQNGAPAGRYPMRLENNFGWTFTIPGTNANVGGKNHFGIYQADGTTELFYVDNTGTTRMALPALNGSDGDYVAILSADGTLKKLAQSAIKGTTNAPANTAETIAGTDNTKFITPFNLAAWWSDVKTRVQTLTNEWNFTGGLKVNGKDVLAGLAATDPETQISASVTEDNKFVSRLKLFNWWTWIKGQAATISGAWNFTGTLKVNGADVLTAGGSGDVSSKLNIGANAGLAATGVAPAIVSANGTIGRDANLAWDAAARNLQVGTPANVGTFTVSSNEFKLKVQDNITSGNASIEFNDNQARALTFRGTDTKEYMAFRTTDGDEAVILLQKYVFDMGIFSPLNNAQTQVSTSAATKLYALDSLGNPFSIPFAVDGGTIFIYGRFKAVNNSGTIGNSVIAGSFEIVLRRIAGVITVVARKTTLLADTLGSSCVVEADSPDNNTIQIYVQPNNATALDWKLSDIKYFV